MWVFISYNTCMTVRFVFQNTKNGTYLDLVAGLRQNSDYLEQLKWTPLKTPTLSSKIPPPTYQKLISIIIIFY